MTRRDTPIPWGDFSEGQVETLIAAWLLRIHPGAQRVDGGGGDDGVDVMVPVDGGIHVFEIKSYNERLTTKQKNAVAKSLKTAAKNRTDMVAWTVVLPLDRSPGEERWMQQTLAQLTSVPLDWIGRTRLELELSAHGDLMRTFAPGAVYQRALDMLAAYNQEQAGPPQTLIEGLQRGQRLRGQLSELDPHYDFDISFHTDSVSAALRAKNEHAPPVHFSLTLRAERGSEAAESIEDFMIYGRSLKLDAENIVSFSFESGALNQLLGLPGALTSLAIGPNPAASSHTPARLHAVDSRGRVLATLPVDWTHLSHGPLGGAYLHGRDRGGFLEVTLTKGTGREGDVRVRTKPVPDLLPSDALPALRFLRQLVVATALHLVSGDQTVRMMLPPSERNVAFAENMVRMAEALDRIQQQTGVVFPLPAEWSDQDGLLVGFYDQLLREGRAVFPFPEVSYVAMPVAVARTLLTQGPFPRGCISGSQDSELNPELFGAKLPLPGRLRFECTDVLVADPLILDQICRADPPWTMVNVRLIADTRTRSIFYLEDIEDQEELGDTT